MNVVDSSSQTGTDAFSAKVKRENKLTPENGKNKTKLVPVDPEPYETTQNYNIEDYKDSSSLSRKETPEAECANSESVEQNSEDPWSEEYALISESGTYVDKE
ncbi:UNVERIFIED_CONTAM: hypothetical protein FKN15_037674 [Acipenser sinensis]